MLLGITVNLLSAHQTKTNELGPCRLRKNWTRPKPKCLRTELNPGCHWSIQPSSLVRISSVTYSRCTVRTRIVQPPPPMTVAAFGTTVTLPCGIEKDAHQSATWQWKYNMTSFVVARRTIGMTLIGRDGSLKMSAVSKDDEGLYTCEVDSTGGDDSRSGLLKVLG